MNMTNPLPLPTVARVLALGVALFALHDVAKAATLTFDTDPFAGTTVRNSPGRQVVGGELFISFNTATDTFVFDAAAFGLTEIRFANGPIGSIPANANVIVLQTTDNDNNPLTPFGAANAADLLAGRITTSGPGLFIYFNQSLNLPRLVYSDDLSTNTADLRILARMLALDGQSGAGALNALPSFAAPNFALAEVPEPSSWGLMTGGVGLLAFGLAQRRGARS